MSFTYERKYRGPVRAVILDWAGTTVDYGCCAPAAVFQEVFAGAGIEITTAEAREPMGADKRDHIEAIAQMPRVAAAWEAKKGAPCSEHDIDTLYATFISRQVDVIKDYAGFIPGTLETMSYYRSRDIRIGSTTGYSREMMDVLMPIAASGGYAPEATVTTTEVPAGRPAPWMAFQCASELGVYPMESIVKIGDTVPDVEEGLNAAMWSVGVVLSGNEVGLPLHEYNRLDPAEQARLATRGRERLSAAGAHYVVDTVEDTPSVIEDIERRLQRGERP